VLDDSPRIEVMQPWVLRTPLVPDVRKEPTLLLEKSYRRSVFRWQLRQITFNGFE
jgi:hypothetical protein